MIPGMILVIYIMLLLYLVFLSMNYKTGKGNDHYKKYAFVSALLSFFNLIFMTVTTYGLVLLFIDDPDDMKGSVSIYPSDENFDLKL